MLRIFTRVILVSLHMGILVFTIHLLLIPLSPPHTALIFNISVFLQKELFYLWMMNCAGHSVNACGPYADFVMQQLLFIEIVVENKILLLVLLFLITVFHFICLSFF